MFNPIEAKKRLTQERIEKSFNDGLSVSEEIEKGRHGIYEDNAENRRKNRVGQEYGHAAQQKELGGKQHGAAKTIDDHASAASDEALKRAAADVKAKPEVREAAKKELESRGEKKLSNKTSGKWYAADASSEDLERYIKDPKSDPKLVKEAKKELESRGVNSGDNKGDAGLGNKVAKQIIDDAKDYYAHNGDYHGYNSLKDYIDSGDWADDVNSDEFEDGAEAMQHVTKSLKKLANGGESGDNKSGKTASAARKDEILKKLKQNATESKEARKAKSSRLKSILEDGTNKDDSIFMSKNESYFKDVLKNHGFDSWDEFEEWGADGADGDWVKYEKIFKTCFNKIPADKFIETKKSSVIDESHGEKLIDNALQQMGYESGRKFEDRSVYAKQLSDWVNEFASKNDKTPSEMYDWLDDNMETLYNLEDMDMDELDEYSDFEGWDELNDIINEMSDAFENPDKEEADFEDMFLGALKSDMGELDNSRKGKAAQKKLVELARDFVNKNPDLNLTIEDWQDIIGGDVDESDEKYGKLKGFRKLNNALERFYDSLD